jgi:hypothetical protein
MNTPHVVITGAAQGLGCALADYYTRWGCTVTGWDIVWGLDQDLSKDTTLDRVIDSCAHADIFFNCADIRQVDYLNAVYELWRGQQNRCIVSISTSATYLLNKHQAQEYFKDPVMSAYIERKRALDQRQQDLYFEQLKSKQYGPWLLNIRPGYQHSTVHPDRHKEPLLDQDLLAERIAQIIQRGHQELILDMVLIAPR